MALVQTAQTMLCQESKVPLGFLTAMKEKYPELPAVEEMAGDEDLKKFIDETKTGRKKKTPEERRGEYDETKCDARIWKNAGQGMGYDNIQCNSKKIGGGCFCKKHQAAQDNGGWWLGKIMEPRPEEPFGPPGSKNPRLHVWNTDAEGNPVEKPSRKKKSPSKAPKKTGKKNSSSKDPAEMSLDELKALLAAKQEEEEKKEDNDSQDIDEPIPEIVENTKDEGVKIEEVRVEVNREDDGKGVGLSSSTDELDKDTEEIDAEEKMITVDGVEYQLNVEDNIVIDPEDMEIMGEWNEKEQRIEYEDDSMKEKHEHRVK